MLRVVFMASCAVMMLSLPTMAHSAETSTYKYDAKGRLKKVDRVRSGTSTGTTSTEYTHDKADNRKKVKITKS